MSSAQTIHVWTNSPAATLAVMIFVRIIALWIVGVFFSRESNLKEDRRRTNLSQEERDEEDGIERENLARF
jgi:hypothetical protein